jgi:hypothetical protein
VECGEAKGTAGHMGPSLVPGCRMRERQSMAEPSGCQRGTEYVGQNTRKEHTPPWTSTADVLDFRETRL